MASLGDLVVNLGLNNSQFKRGLSESQSGLKNFSDSGTKSINPVSKAFSALTATAVGCSAAMSAVSTSLADDFLVGAVAVGAAVWGLTSRIESLAGVADKAAQTGLSGKFLQQLEYAADQSGVSAETLTGGIKKLTVLVGKAADGSKEAASALASVGLSAENLQSLSPESQFEKITEAIGKIPTAAGRASAAVKIFGKSGIEMTGLFADGVDGLNALLKDAQELGIGLDAASLKKAADADDAIQRMKASFTALIDQVAVGLAPAFQSLATEISGAVAPATNLVAKFNELPEKMKFIGDIAAATFDVATESIRVKWDDMLLDMLSATKNFAKDAAWNLIDPFGGAMGAGAAGLKMGAGAGNSENLDAAKARLNALLGQIQGPPVAAGGGNGGAPGRGQFMQKPLQKGDNGLASAVGGLFEQFKPISDAAGFAAQGIVDRTKIRAEAAMGTLSNIFTGKPAETAKKVEPRLAGAMQAGSQEAYSTIVQAMVRQSDPVVKATEKQTRELVKTIKNQPATRLAYVKAFEGVNEA